MLRRIRKRFLTVDVFGRPLTSQTERLADDGRGHVSVVSRQLALWCPGCRRPVAGLQELRGRCDYCRVRGLCDHCETQCQACSRRLCFACRRGFIGPNAATVCPICHYRLRLRQAVVQSLWQQAVRAERSLLLQQERMRRRAAYHQAWRALAGRQLELQMRRHQARLLAARSQYRALGPLL